MPRGHPEPTNTLSTWAATPARIQFNPMITYLPTQRRAAAQPDLREGTTNREILKDNASFSASN